MAISLCNTLDGFHCKQDLVEPLSVCLSTSFSIAIQLFPQHLTHVSLFIYLFTSTIILFTQLYHYLQLRPSQTAPCYIQQQLPSCADSHQWDECSSLWRICAVGVMISSVQFDSVYLGILFFSGT
jgi:hypothetical protein